MSNLHNIQIKHRQHYVFQSYLKNWSLEDRLWCYRDGKCFRANTVNVAQERDFYRIRDLNDDEERFLLMLADHLPGETATIMKKHIALYKRPLRWKQGVSELIDVTKEKIYKDKPIPDDVQTLIRYGEQLVESAVNDTIEDLYSAEEGMLTVFLEELKQRKRDFYDNPYAVQEMAFRDSKQAFLYSVCSQHFRTKGAYSRWKSGFVNIDKNILNALGINKNNIRPDHIAYQVFLHVEGQGVDYLEAKGAKLTILVNETAVPFLTSDQPVINLKADYHTVTEEIDGIVFYYPITPNLAILVNSDYPNDEYNVTETEVDKYNRAVIAASNEFIFSNTVTAIKRYHEEKY